MGKRWVLPMYRAVACFTWSAYTILFREQGSYGFVWSFFFLGHDLTFSVPSHANYSVFIFHTCFLNQPLSAHLWTHSIVLSVEERLFIKHIPHLYVFVVSRSIKVPGPWAAAASTLLRTSVAPAAPRPAPLGWSPSGETRSPQGSWSKEQTQHKRGFAAGVPLRVAVMGAEGGLVWRWGNRQAELGRGWVLKRWSAGSGAEIWASQGYGVE